MAEFINLFPIKNQEDVSRTTVISFTIQDTAPIAQIGRLSASISGTLAISNGSFVNGYSGNIATGTNKYVVGIYPKSPFLSRAAKIDIILSVRDAYNSLVEESYSFYTSGYTETETPSAASSSTVRSCSLVKPYFPPANLGLRFVKDNGIGTEVELEWETAYPYNENNVIYYNVYASTDRSLVFDGYPEFFVEDTGATIGGLRPGDQYFFGVRVAEFNPNYVTTSGRIQVGPNLYKYSTSQVDGYFDETQLFVPSVSTSGFPDYGILLIRDELIRYTSKSSTGFTVAATGRGFSGTGAEGHGAGSLIRLYWGMEDENNFIVQCTPSFQKPNYAITYVQGDGYGADGYRDGYDGYAFYDGYLRIKQQPFDNITTSGTNNDASGEFPRYDYCGTYRSSPRSFMQGQCVNSYFGGAQVRFDSEGNRHLVKETDLSNHMFQREELLLESTGEPFVLVRRMWTGIRCPCVMMRREHQDARCPICFSSGFVQGYVQFFNPRRSDRRILVRVDPTVDDVNIFDRGGLEPMFEPNAWTLAFPAVKDRDILIRFNPDNTEEWRYEVLDVTRVRAFFNQTGAQKFRMKRFPKTDIIYQFPVLRDARPRPGALITSTATASGLNPHSHQYVLPEGANILTYKGATLISEGHNHVIINGVVQNVVGHTHTL